MYQSTSVANPSCEPVQAENTRFLAQRCESKLACGRGRSAHRWHQCRPCHPWGLRARCHPCHPWGPGHLHGRSNASQHEASQSSESLWAQRLVHHSRKASCRRVSLHVQDTKDTESPGTGCTRQGSHRQRRPCRRCLACLHVATVSTVVCKTAAKRHATLAKPGAYARQPQRCTERELLQANACLKESISVSRKARR